MRACITHLKLVPVGVAGMVVTKMPLVFHTRWLPNIWPFPTVIQARRVPLIMTRLVQKRQRRSQTQQRRPTWQPKTKLKHQWRYSSTIICPKSRHLVWVVVWWVSHSNSMSSSRGLFRVFHSQALLEQPRLHLKRWSKSMLRNCSPETSLLEWHSRRLPLKLFNDLCTSLNRCLSNNQFLPRAKTQLVKLRW